MREVECVCDWKIHDTSKNSSDQKTHMRSYRIRDTSTMKINVAKGYMLVGHGFIRQGTRQEMWLKNGVFFELGKKKMHGKYR